MRIKVHIAVTLLMCITLTACQNRYVEPPISIPPAVTNETDIIDSHSENTTIDDDYLKPSTSSSIPELPNSLQVDESTIVPLPTLTHSTEEITTAEPTPQHAPQEAPAQTPQTEKVDELFPVRLNESNFYVTSASNPTVYFNVDWENISASKSITYVEYTISANTPDGLPAIASNGNTHITLRSFENSVTFGEHNVNYRSNLGLEFCDASVFFIEIARAEDEQGKIYVNGPGTATVKCVLTGRKGFAFGEYKDKRIDHFVEQFSQYCVEHGLELGNPQVYIYKGEFAVLRYPSLDVRLEFSSDNFEKNSFSLVEYNEPFDSSSENFQATVDEALTRMQTYIGGILPFTFNVSQADADLAADAFFNGDDENIFMGGTEYIVLTKGAGAYAENKNLQHMSIIAVGDCVYDAVNFWHFAKQYPYDNNTAPSPTPIQSPNIIYPQDENDYIVKWVDDELKRVVSLALGKTGDVWRSDLDEISTFEIREYKATLLKGTFFCDSEQISSLEDFTHFNNLRSLWFEKVPVIIQFNWNALTHLDSLTDIRIMNCDIYDINQLVGLVELHQIRWLSLRNNHLTDITPITNMTHLVWLELYNNSIEDISGVENMTQLTDLSLRDNKIIDVSPLADLTSLKYLNLSNNNIVNITPIYNNNYTLLSIDGNNLAMPEFNDS